jgi:hypothetical protein
VFFAFTAAPGTDPPELSVTVPVMLAVAACPRSFWVPKQASKHTLNTEIVRSPENRMVFTLIVSSVSLEALIESPTYLEPKAPDPVKALISLLEMEIPVDGPALTFAKHPEVERDGCS